MTANVIVEVDAVSDFDEDGNPIFGPVDFEF